MNLQVKNLIAICKQLEREKLNTEEWVNLRYDLRMGIIRCTHVPDFELVYKPCCTSNKAADTCQLIRVLHDSPSVMKFDT